MFFSDDASRRAEVAKTDKSLLTLLSRVLFKFRRSVFTGAWLTYAVPRSSKIKVRTVLYLEDVGVKGL